MTKSKEKKHVVFLTVLFTTLIGIVLSGCSHAVKYTVDEEMLKKTPQTVAVLPVEWSDKVKKEDDGIAAVFRSMASLELQTLNYRTPTIKSIDNLIEKKRLSVNTPGSVASGLGTDAVLVIEITDWDSDILITYAYLKVKARFSLYGTEGEKLWSAEYSTAESNIKLDKESMELSVIKVYEPRVQRFINDIFSTLPPSVTPVKTKSYFNWLP